METAEPANRETKSGRCLPGGFVLCMVALAASAVVAPFFFLGSASGHDIQFHLSSWMDVAGQWREGVLYPRWAEWSNWGFGEPRFIFYPPLSWLIGAALGSILPWKAAAGAYVWLVLVVAGASMWRLSREWLPGPQACAAAVLFAVNPYNLALVYYRSDFAELLAVAFLPLLALAIWGIAQDRRREIPRLAVVFAAIWLCSAPEGVVATYSIALLLAIALVRRRSLRPLLFGSLAMVAGFALAAVYILPALWEQRWVQIAQALSVDLRPERNFLFARAGNPEFLLFNWKISLVALGTMIATGIAAFFAARYRKNTGGIQWTLYTLGIAASFLMVPPSAPLWRYLPKLAFLQFPWRWLGPLGLVFAFFAAEAMGLLHGRTWKFALCLVFLAIGITGLLIGRSGWWNGEDVDFLRAEIHSGHGYEGTDEYAPLACDRYQLPGATPDAEEIPDVPETPRVAVAGSDNEKAISADGTKVAIEQWNGQHKRFAVSAAQPVTLALRLLNYPAWQVRIDGKDVPPESASMTAQMLLPVPAGNHRVEIAFRRTWDRIAGDAVSILAAIGLVAYGMEAARSKRTVR